MEGGGATAASRGFLNLLGEARSNDAIDSMKGFKGRSKKNEERKKNLVNLSRPLTVDCT